MDLAISSFLAAIATMAAPLLIAALGETISEKGGVVNLSLDGTILLSAMVGFAAASNTQSLFLGFGAAAIAGAAVALLLAVIGVWLNQSQVAVGFALTFLCRDLAYFLGNPYSRQQGPQLETLYIPGLSQLPLLGKALFSHTLIVYLSFLLIPCVIFFIKRTKLGLHIRMAGENQESCWARGVNPKVTRTIAAVIGGSLIGLAGGAYSLAVKPGWGHPQGCEGIGWIALALVIFGGWQPLRVVFGAYFFGMLQLLGIYFQDYFTSIPPQIFQVAPFPLMIFILVLIHFSQKTKSGKRAFISRLFRGKSPQQLGIGHTRQ